MQTANSIDSYERAPVFVCIIKIMLENKIKSKETSLKNQSRQVHLYNGRIDMKIEYIKGGGSVTIEGFQ